MEDDRPAIDIKKFDTFGLAAADLVLDRAALDSAQAQCLTKYLTELRVASYVVEPRYTDAGYLLDYAHYYSRCHTEYRKDTHRLHFFSLEPQRLKELFDAAFTTGTAPDEIAANYQGFVVVKPLPRTVIGRTCLRTYLPYDPESRRRRVFPILRPYSASLFGLDLKLDSIAFQEQDRETAACATAAIWYALHGMHKKIATQDIPSPYEITNASSTTYIKRSIGEVARRFPTGGLGLEQIESYLRGYGLECIVCGIRSDELGEKLKDYLAAYVDAGYPMVVVGNMYVSEAETRGFRHVGLHAVTALGYGVSPDFQQGSDSARIERLYAHDDNVGPFTSFRFQPCRTRGEFAAALAPHPGPVQDALGYLSNQSGLAKERVTYRRFVPVYLVIPINQKVRLPYEVVQTFANQMGGAYAAKRGVWFERSKSPDLAWSIRLVEVSKLKSDIWKAKGITRDADLGRLLQKPMPKYIWRLTFTGHLERSETPWVEVLIDATDLLQGGGVVAILTYDLHPGSDAFLSLLVASVREWVHRHSDQAHPDVLPLLYAIDRGFESD